MYGNKKKNDYLEHHGILGMHWGVRRYQNKDGTLTSAGKKRYGSIYKDEVTKARDDVSKNATQRYANAYNQTANEYNTTKLAAFDKKHKSTDDDYDDAFEKIMNEFESDVDKRYNQMLVKDIQKNEHYIKAQELVKQYNMESFDEFVKQTQRELKEMEG